jgi:hypothetical protein
LKYKGKREKKEKEKGKKAQVGLKKNVSEQKLPAREQIRSSPTHSTLKHCIYYQGKNIISILRQHEPIYTLNISYYHHNGFKLYLLHVDGHRLHEHQILRSNHCKDKYVGPIPNYQSQLPYILLLETYDRSFRVKLVNNSRNASENSSEKC